MTPVQKIQILFDAAERKDRIARHIVGALAAIAVYTFSVSLWIMFKHHQPPPFPFLIAFIGSVVVNILFMRYDLKRMKDESNDINNLIADETARVINQMIDAEMKRAITEGTPSANTSIQ